MQNYIQQPKQQNSQKLNERMITALTKSGYIKPFSIFIKTLPDLDQGLKVVGFLNEITDSELQQYYKMNKINKVSEIYYMLYNSISGHLLGVSENMRQNFGVTKHLINGSSSLSSEFSVDIICPGLTDENNIEHMDSISGLMTHIDTLPIKHQF